MGNAEQAKGSQDCEIAVAQPGVAPLIGGMKNAQGRIVQGSAAEEIDSGRRRRTVRTGPRVKRRLTTLIVE
jgi:hypothetical protein